MTASTRESQRLSLHNSRKLLLTKGACYMISQIKFSFEIRKRTFLENDAMV